MVHLVSFIALYTGISSNITTKYQRLDINQKLSLDQAFANHPDPNKSCMELLIKETLLSEKQARRWLCEKGKKERINSQTELTQFTCQLV